MQRFGPGFLILAACLSGCGQHPAYNSTETAEHHGGRYLGIGVYPASDLWQHLTAPDRGADPHAATLADDTQLIVVVDSNSGEIRQCGNMSGHCIGMNPWAAALGQGRAAPVTLDAHQADLDNEARENSAATNAAVEDVPARATRSRRR
jgi:hypothetical protein